MPGRARRVCLTKRCATSSTATPPPTARQRTSGSSAHASLAGAPPTRRACSRCTNHNTSHSHHHLKNAHPVGGPEATLWPVAFHAHVYALVWCTYCAAFEPIRDLPSLSALRPPLVVPSALLPSSPSPASHNNNHNNLSNNNTKHGHGHSPTQSDSSYSNSSVSSTSSRGTRSGGDGSTASARGTKRKWWPLGGTKGWTSDAGWGACCARGRVCSRVVGKLDTLPAPHFPPPTARLLSWFLDAPVSPFGVLRMALTGKALGKDVGMWFVPSAAAGAIRTFVDTFPAAGLGVSVYQTEAFAPSHSPPSAAGLASSSSPAVGGHSSAGHGKSTNAKPGKRWADRPVLLLLGIRLGLDGVNPVYYETIKLLYTFLQAVGIAGDRPSSS
ncbi:hypothetical protein B0H10DRAFT_1325361 [Mycena sp. CBHHK59/15]|nr:hypothetical protein B0H10DRAFT_1325361 [Mycena sp. CBHHK59/15]